ncbi:hypothetical protein [Maribacter thermophilus]|uniref:hypothetical protein n=1 Tax=Maribacter thermophilus TaxID=1197874 RepID=UPI000640FF20|nr:hypothetical protein [Maribacter thermophilus]
MKSHFKSDLNKEKRLALLIDSYYLKYIQYYNYHRIGDIEKQLEGIDVLFTNKISGKIYAIDEKAQLDYINEDLPTFAFEISYLKNNIAKKGWLFDLSKKTDFYALITAIYEDEPDTFTSCKITIVNRKKLICLLKEKGVSELSISKRWSHSKKPHGKIILNELDSRSEGYIYYSKNNKVEKPLNLVLKLDFLINNGIAKRLC